jgi:hypothetical protein
MLFTNASNRAGMRVSRHDDLDPLFIAEDRSALIFRSNHILNTIDKEPRMIAPVTLAKIGARVRAICNRHRFSFLIARRLDQFEWV